MIKKILPVTIILLVGYSVFVAFLAPKWWHASQYQRQQNIIETQNYIYGNDHSCKNIIVGSSLSARLTIDSLPETCDLAFHGQTIYEGLNLLTREDRLPKNILIEQTYVLRDEDKTFVSSIYSPILFYARKNLLILRADRQPLGVISAKVNVITRAFLAVYRLFLKPKRVENKIEWFSNILDGYIEQYSHLPDQATLDEHFNVLKKYTTQLESKGANIVFFEVPLDRHLNNSPRANMQRETFYKYFPQSKYQYIPIPDSLNLETTDGTHLDGASAFKYTMYLKSQMKN